MGWNVSYLAGGWYLYGDSKILWKRGRNGYMLVEFYLVASQWNFETSVETKSSVG